MAEGNPDKKINTKPHHNIVENDELVKKLARYGFVYGSIITIGAIFVATAFAIFITETVLLPNVLAKDPKATLSFGILLLFDIPFSISGVVLLGYGALMGKKKFENA